MKTLFFDKAINAGIVLLAFAGLAVAAAHTEPSQVAAVVPWVSASEYVSAMPAVKDLEARGISSISVRCDQPNHSSKVLRVQVDYLQDGDTHTIYTPKTCRLQGLEMLIRPQESGWLVQSATKYNKSVYGEVVGLVHGFSTPRT